MSLKINMPAFHQYFRRLLVINLIFANSVSALTLHTNEFIPTIITVSGGPTWTRGGDTQTLNLANEITKTYTADKPTNVAGQVELFVGIQRILSSNLLGQLGLSLAKISAADLAGEIWDDANPAFNNFDYEYRLNHFRLALKGKLFLKNNGPFMPYFSASAGVGFNRSYDFTNTPKISEALPNPNFASDSIPAFTYTLGFGIEHRMIQNWLIGIGYEFADWGGSQLGKATGQTTAQRITLNHFYTHSLLLNVSYDACDMFR